MNLNKILSGCTWLAVGMLLIFAIVSIIQLAPLAPSLAMRMQALLAVP